MELWLRSQLDVVYSCNSDAKLMDVNTHIYIWGCFSLFRYITDLMLIDSYKCDVLKLWVCLSTKVDWSFHCLQGPFQVWLGRMTRRTIILNFKSGMPISKHQMSVLLVIWLRVLFKELFGQLDIQSPKLVLYP